jgi:hypothetical protein
MVAGATGAARDTPIKPMTTIKVKIRTQPASTDFRKNFPLSINVLLLDVFSLHPRPLWPYLA